jgi:hypothetical protein
MLQLAIKAAVSGIVIALASTVAKRYPTAGALIASLPLVSVVGMIWLWSEKPDRTTMLRQPSGTSYHRCRCSYSSPPCCDMTSAFGQRWPAAAPSPWRSISR